MNWIEMYVSRRIRWPDPDLGAPVPVTRFIVDIHSAYRHNHDVFITLDKKHVYATYYQTAPKIKRLPHHIPQTFSGHLAPSSSPNREPLNPPHSISLLPPSQTNPLLPPPLPQIPSLFLTPPPLFHISCTP